MMNKDVERLEAEIIEKAAQKVEEKMKGQVPDELVKKTVDIVMKELKSANKVVIPGSDVEPGTFAKGLKKAMSEGTGSSGGFLVPTSYVNKIIDIAKVKSIVLANADITPVATNQAQVPVLVDGVHFTWTNENTAGTESDPTFGQLSLTVKKGLGITTIPNELLDDKTIGGAVDQYLVKLYGRAFAKEIDRVGFVGDTGHGDPFNGVLNTPGVTVIVGSTGETAPEYQKLVDMVFAINDDYATSPVWIAHRSFYAQCFKLEDNEGRPLLVPEAKTLIAFPYIRSERMPHDFSAGKKIAIFGDPSNIRVAMRQNLVIEASKHVGFKADQTVLRAKFRLAIGVAPADAFAVYQLAAAS